MTTTLRRSAERYRYRVYGVRLSTDLPFDFQPSTDSTPAVADVELLRGDGGDFEPAAALGEASGDDFVCHVLADRSTYVRWSDLYEFRVAGDGARVVCRLLQSGTGATLQHYLVGQALSFALVQQRVEPYHAAVVRIDDVAVAFVGDSTYGKSTLAASFLQAGYPLLTDDLLVVDWTGGCPMAVPGSGRIKLMPDSAGAFLDSTEPGVALVPQWAKLSYRLPERLVQRTPLPLAHVFVLPDPDERDSHTSIATRPLPRAALVHALVQNTFNVDLLHRERLVRQFECASGLAWRVQGFALQHPLGLEYLPLVRQQIVDRVRETRRRIQ